MAFKHPCFMEIVAECGIPHLATDRDLIGIPHHRVITIYHSCDDENWPEKGMVGNGGVCNIWGKFILPVPTQTRLHAYIRVPKLDRAIILALERDQKSNRGVVKESRQMEVHRFIDLGGIS